MAGSLERKIKKKKIKTQEYSVVFRVNKIILGCKLNKLNIPIKEENSQKLNKRKLRSLTIKSCAYKIQQLNYTLLLPRLTRQVQLPQQRKKQIRQSNQFRLIFFDLAINQKNECQRKISKLEKEILEFKQNTRKTKTQIENFKKRCETKSQTLRFSLQKAVNESEQNITYFQQESENYESKNVDLRQKKKQLKAKLQQLENNYERNSDKKDIEKREETEALLSEMKTAEKQTDKVTTLQQTQKVLQKECSEAKVSIYRRVQMFPKFEESFETSAQTFTTCKEQIIKGVSRLNVALSTIKENEPKLINQNTEIAEKARIKNSKQEKVDDIKEKIAKVQAHIEELKKNQKK